MYFCIQDGIELEQLRSVDAIHNENNENYKRVLGIILS